MRRRTLSKGSLGVTQLVDDERGDLLDVLLHAGLELRVVEPGQPADRKHVGAVAVDEEAPPLQPAHSCRGGQLVGEGRRNGLQLWVCHQPPPGPTNERWGDPWICPSRGSRSRDRTGLGRS